MKTHYEAIVVGGGVAGLACALDLKDAGTDFLLIAKEIGGRLLAFGENRVNFGAYVLPGTDRQVLRLVERTARVHPFHLDFHSRRRGYSFWQIFRHWKELVRFYPFIVRYRLQYARFREHAMREGQRSAFDAFPEIRRLYETGAGEFVRERGIATITRKFLGEPVWMCTFAKLRDLNAFDFLHVVMNLGIPVYRFRSRVPEVVSDLGRETRLGEVVSIEESDTVRIRLSDGSSLTCDRLVLALPRESLGRLLPIRTDKVACGAYLFWIAGTVRPEFCRGDLELFDECDEAIFLSREPDGTTVYYATVPEPAFDRFFSSYEILERWHWNPAFFLGGRTITDPDFSDRITLAGDMNVVGLEDSFVSGRYAARRTLGLLSDRI